MSTEHGQKLKEAKTLSYEELKDLGRFGFLCRRLRRIFFKPFLFFNPLHLAHFWSHHSTEATLVKLS